MRSSSFAPEERFAHRLLGSILLIGLAIIFLGISLTGQDVFREPKALALKGLGVILLATAGILLVQGKLPWRNPLRQVPALAIPLAAVLWTSIATVFSTRRGVSLETLQFVTAAAAVAATALFLAAAAARRGSSAAGRLPGLWIAIALALINGLVLTSQWLGWKPLELDPRYISHHLGRTALIGNPNEVGTFMIAPALAALVLAMVSRGRMRWVAGGTAAALALFLVLSGTRTAVAAFLAAIFALTLTISLRRALLISVAAVGILAVSVIVSPRFLRFDVITDAIERRDMDVLLSGRVVAFTTAADMARQRPLIGLGPGTFSNHYFQWKIQAQEQHPRLLFSGSAAKNFGEAHNDHLELVIEGGVPAYLLFLAALVTLGSGSFRRKPVGALIEARFARACAFPLAVALFVVTLAQFPLQVAGPATMFLYLGSLICSWSRLDEAD
ncbi:MAG TPA: O-antigen ligase family protein [Thermoanaerobaculia bacterium]|nr:O-antigen ligase family protein [Thermoanaerobaculia bacterium]